jgi:phosphoheptose isomerase
MSAGLTLSMDARDRVRKHLAGSIVVKQRTLLECESAILAAAAAVVDAMRSGGKLMLCGNGGSAADCQHIAAELVSTLNHQFPRQGFPAIALTTDSSIITASANDFGYDGIFERQAQALGRAGDVLAAITTSGNSTNVLRAVRYASAHGMRTIGLTGSPGGDLAGLVEIAICVPSSCTQHIQETHITIGHILCDLVEQALCRGQ